MAAPEYRVARIVPFGYRYEVASRDFPGNGDDSSTGLSRRRNMRPGCGAPWQGADYPTRPLAAMPAYDLLVANLQRISATLEST